MHHQEHEHGCADERGHDAHLKLAGHNQHAAQNIGGEHERRAVHERERQHPPDIGAGQQANDVGNDQTHEADGAGDCGRGAAERHDGHDGRGAHQGDGHAQAGGRILTESQRAQRADQHEGKHQAHRHERQGREHLLEGAVFQGADHPEAVRVEGLGVKHRDDAGNGSQAGVDRHAGQHETGRRVQVGFGVDQAHHEDEGCGHAGTQQGQPQLHEWGGHSEDTHAHDHGGGRTRVHAQQARLGQRVAAQRLHEHARYRQGRTHQQRRGGARCAFGPDELGLDGVRVRVQEAIDGPIQGEHARTHREGESAEDHEQQASEDERDGDARDRRPLTVLAAELVGGAGERPNRRDGFLAGGGAVGRGARGGACRGGCGVLWCHRGCLWVVVRLPYRR